MIVEVLSLTMLCKEKKAWFYLSPSFSASSMIGLPHANVPSSVDLEPHHNLEPVVVENDAAEEIRDLMHDKKKGIQQHLKYIINNMQQYKSVRC